MTFTSESQAIRILEMKGFEIERNAIRPPKDRKDESDVSVLEAQAIDYLAQEHGYGYG